MADEFDFDSRVSTWRIFTTLLRYSIAGIVAVLVLMAIFLV